MTFSSYPIQIFCIDLALSPDWCSWKSLKVFRHGLHSIDNKNCNPLQFNYHYDGDSISVYKVDSTDGSKNLIARLSGPDNGPKSKLYNSNWEEKVISTSSNTMEVVFKSDGDMEYRGFSATIHFTLLQCESWMDMKKQILESPNYPNTYGNDIFCNYLITVQPDFHITLDFLEFDVSFLIIPI